MVNFFLPCREDSLRESVKQSCFSFLVISGIAFLTSYGQLTLLLLTSQRQALKIRKLYLRSLFRQEMGWYDLNDSGELVTHIAKSVLLLFQFFFPQQPQQHWTHTFFVRICPLFCSDVLLIQDGIGEKMGTFVQFIAMFLGGFVVGFVYSWKMSLVILSVTPILMVCGAFLGKLMADFSTKGQTFYAKAGGIAEEVISCIRTVAAFGG